MDTMLLDNKFARMGARLRIREEGAGGRWRRDLPLTLDVQKDDRGEFFDIRLGRETAVELDVLDLRKRERHLLLRAATGREQHLYLCGHDERHWFVAAVPQRPGVSNVALAMEALKPPEVLAAQARQGLNSKERRSRKNAAFRRQGEWFFLPAPHLKVAKWLILHNEPFSRGGGSKPHWAQMAYRTGGQTVHVCDQHPNGLTGREYQALMAGEPRARRWNWRTMRRDASMFVKGRIRHDDHKTLHLFEWHRVLMNTESQARAMRHVVFLD